MRLGGVVADRLRTNGARRVALSDLEVALLGLLSIQPMTGYDIGRYYERALVPFWVVPRTQIYPRLKDLEDRGLVESEHVVQESRPNKRVYRLTAAGRGELTAWLGDAIGWIEMKHALLIRVFLGNLFEEQELRRLLVGYRDEVDSWADELRKVREKFRPSLQGEHAPSVFFQLLSLEHLIALADLERDGTDRILAAVNEATVPLGESDGTSALLEIVKDHFDRRVGQAGNGPERAG